MELLKRNWHIIVLVLIAYAIGVIFPAPGQAVGL